jgi:hypothetical protein
LPPPVPEPHVYLSADERRAQGRALRYAVPRSAHAFAVACSDQNRADHRVFIKTIRQGRIEVQSDI